MSNVHAVTQFVVTFEQGRGEIDTELLRSNVGALLNRQYDNTVTVDTIATDAVLLTKSEGDYAETCETSEKSIDPSNVPVITLHLGPELGDVQIFDDTMSLPVQVLNPPIVKNVVRARLEAIFSMLDAPVYQPRYPTHPGAAARRATGRRYGRNPEEQD